MTEWILYILIVSSLISVAAWIAERSARLSRHSTRWIWLVSMIASLAIPSIISSVSIQVPSIVAPTISSHAITLRDNTLAQLSPQAWMHQAISTTALVQWDRLLRNAWTTLSVMLLLLIFASAVHLSLHKRQWSEATLLGVPVYLSQDTGPAVVGLMNPRIVIPQWIIQSSTIDKSLVIAHEQSHLHAGDQRVLTIALCLLVLMPWNIPLWWQLKRLRHAIEVDCDARVLRAGHAPELYGETLIEVGQRQSSFVGAVAAMSESASFLEQRITIMMYRPSKSIFLSATALTVLAISVAAIAVEVTPPDAKSLTAHTEKKFSSSSISAESASQIQDPVALKIRSQTPNPRSEPILRQWIADLESRSTKYSYMSNDMRNATLQQLPVFREELSKMGKVTSVEFRGVGTQGWDVFEIHHERGMTLVRMFVDSNGILTGMLLSDGP